MRHEKLLLTIEESQAVVTEINRWCRRTGTNYNKFVTAAGVRPSLRSSVRRGCRLTIDTAQIIRATMKDNPHGISKQDHKRRIVRRTRQRLERIKERREAEYPAVRVDRTPCPKCGVRRDAKPTCKHWKSIDG